MVTALLAAGGLNAYAAGLTIFDVHGHGSHATHDHAAHDHGDDHDHGNVSDAADTTHDNEDPASKCGLCTHMHVHSCCVYAVPAADLTLKLSPAHSSVPVAASHIPHGQLAAPLFRPPRAIA